MEAAADHLRHPRLQEHSDRGARPGVHDDNPFSIASSLYWARENARIIREVISGEMWERINFYHLWLQGSGSRATYKVSRVDFYAQVRRVNQLMHGICDATMSHGEAWAFFQLGTYLERANQVARILDVKYHMILPKLEDVGTPADNAQWLAILMSCSGYEAYHKNVRTVPVEPSTSIAEFLNFDELFPRSIHRCLWECEAAAANVAGNLHGREPTEPEKRIAALVQWIDERTIQSLFEDGLHESLTHIVEAIHDIGASIHSTFFAAEVKPPRKQIQIQGQ